MCALHAGNKGLNVRVLEKGRKFGLKILISGGGRCNFTNLGTDPRKHFLSRNAHFCISAMRRYEPAAFIAMVEARQIAYHEKKLGQLFCDGSARQIVAMLVDECEAAGVGMSVDTEVTAIVQQTDGTFIVHSEQQQLSSRKVVIACGGLSIPKIASDLAFKTANALNINVVPPRAALVPFTWNPRDKQRYACLSGISLDAEASCNGATFRENILFTHRGLSGPAVLQVSSFWREGDIVSINLLPGVDAGAWLHQSRDKHPQQRLGTLLKTRFPKRFVDQVTGVWFENAKLGGSSPSALTQVGERLNAWQFTPGGTEGYRTAEVTLGGIDTDELSSKTFELKKVPGLYAIGEAVDVTGWLGGYNFQWAWASAYSCAQYL